MNNLVENVLLGRIKIQEVTALLNNFLFRPEDRSATKVLSRYGEA